MPARSVLISGASGAVLSVASFAALVPDSLSYLSIAFAVTGPTGILATSIVAIPSSLAVPVPISVLSLSYNLTVDPGSAFTSTVTGVFVSALPARSVLISGTDGFLITFPSNLATGADASDATPAPLCL